MYVKIAENDAIERKYAQQVENYQNVKELLRQMGR